MAITRTAPHDYEKRILVVSRLVRLCEECGAHVVSLPPSGELACMVCKHTGFVEVWEHMAAAFRRGLEEKQEETAQMLERIAAIEVEYPAGLLAARRADFVEKVKSV